MTDGMFIKNRGGGGNEESSEKASVLLQRMSYPTETVITREEGAA